MPHTDSTAASTAKTTFLAALYFPVLAANRVRNFSVNDYIDAQLEGIQNRAYDLAYRNFRL